MAPVHTDDYYAVLEISQTASVAFIKASYRRLAKLKHPDKALQDQAKATAEFQRLQHAYSVLCDSEQRLIYDRQYETVRRACKADTTKTNVPPQQTTSREGPDQTKHSSPEWERKLQELLTRKATKDSTLFEEKRQANRLRADLKIINEEVTRFEKEEAASSKWTAYFASFVVKETPKTDEDKTKRHTDQLHRTATQRIKEHLLKQREKVIGKLEEDIIEIETEIIGVRLNIFAAKHEAEAHQARQRQAEAAERIRAEQERLRKERETRARAEAERAAQAAEAARYVRQKQAEAAERLRAEQERITKELEARFKAEATRREKENEEADRGLLETA
ncbi:hypothetical protein H2198_002784 [Neophaeococcomyces mojaviensis]|uniref:Uncharacterized protein n=1 Tax=Neophaeococcomyces mojaviensis TaxID=3383035 RepID=A0ACC3ADN8_9EURO|nr:hypothetical protein H2198_002784 [Knufia sp. JES_112]